MGTLLLSRTSALRAGAPLREKRVTKKLLEKLLGKLQKREGVPLRMFRGQIHRTRPRSQTRKLLGKLRQKLGKNEGLPQRMFGGQIHRKRLRSQERKLPMIEELPGSPTKKLLKKLPKITEKPQGLPKGLLKKLPNKLPREVSMELLKKLP